MSALGAWPACPPTDGKVVVAVVVAAVLVAAVLVVPSVADVAGVLVVTVVGAVTGDPVDWGNPGTKL